MNHKIGIALIIVSVILAAIALIAGCTARPQASQSVELPQTPPVLEPSSVIRRERLDSGLEVIEFRDSAGRICVIAAARNGTGFWGSQPVLDCGFPMRYEDMPEQTSLKRPL